MKYINCNVLPVKKYFFSSWSLKLNDRSQRRWQRSRLRPFLPSLTITEMGRWARRSSSSLWNQKRAKRDPNSNRKNISSLYHCYHPADRQHSFIFPYSSTIRDKQSDSNDQYDSPFCVLQKYLSQPNIICTAPFYSLPLEND